MVHSKGTPKTHHERIPRPSGDPHYYDGLSRRATVEFIVTDDGQLVLLRRDDRGTPMDKFFAGRDFRTVRVISLPDAGAIAMVEAVPHGLDYRIIGTITTAMEYEIMEQQDHGPIEWIRTYTPRLDNGHGYSHI